MKILAMVAALIWTMMCAPQVLGANPPKKMYRIGYLVVAPLADTPSPERAAFFEGLRELGYEEGKNLRVEYRSAEGDLERLPFLADDLVDLKVDLIVCAGEVPAAAARSATHSIPIVMLFAPDPVGNGLIKSLARPGVNVTGMTHVAPELGAKRLELLHATVPRVKRVAVLWNSKYNLTVEVELRSVQAAARTLGMTIEPVDLAQGLSNALAAISKHPPDALMTIVDVRTAAYANIISEFALEHRLPSITGLRDFAVAGGLLSYAANFTNLSRRASTYVDKILRGANPADLPIQQPTQYELVVNLKTARALGIKVPQSILIRANEVIR
jgi:putative ABC transport system substrate-binding protein